MSKTFQKGLKRTTGVAVLLLVLLSSWFLLNQQLTLGVFLLVGLGLGYIESHSNVGIGSGFVEFFATGSRSRLNGLLLLFGSGAISALFVHMQAASEGMVPEYMATSGQNVIPGTGAVSPVNFGLILGSFLFGVGLTLNKGCGMGTLRSIGLGHSRYLITFFFMLVGTIPGQYVKYLFDQSPLHEYSVELYLPDAFGYGGTAVIIVVLLAVAAGLALLYDKRRRKKGTDTEVEKKMFPDIKTEEKEHPVIFYLLQDHWSRLISILLITVLLLVALISTGEELAVTQPFVYPAVALFQNLGFTFSSPAFSEPVQVVQEGLFNHHSVVQNIGIIVGALVFALTSLEYSISWNANVKEVGWFSLSGLLMGFGAILASGCIVGALYSGIVNLSLSGWVVFASMSFGAWITVKAMNGKLGTIPGISKE